MAWFGSESNGGSVVGLPYSQSPLQEVLPPHLHRAALLCLLPHSQQVESEDRSAHHRHEGPLNARVAADGLELWVAAVVVQEDILEEVFAKGCVHVLLSEAEGVLGVDSQGQGLPHFELGKVYRNYVPPLSDPLELEVVIAVFAFAAEGHKLVLLLRGAMGLRGGFGVCFWVGFEDYEGDCEVSVLGVFLFLFVCF